MLTRGFTIVELLIVVVVIGVLAVITTIAFNGVTGRATASQLQSTLSSAVKQLKVFQVDNGQFPTANVCPSPGAT
ncbi:MAG: ral secretion pathway protein, partial [Patescibacteria group bacterium]|nr:ral secretion pathway protein [Patescibacteria group bacterium]